MQPIIYVYNEKFKQCFTVSTKTKYYKILRIHCVTYGGTEYIEERLLIDQLGPEDLQ